MAAIDTGARIRATALAEIDKQCFGEEFGFDVFPGIVVENGTPVICYTMVFTKAVPLLASGPVLLGQTRQTPKMMNVSRIQGADPSDEQVTETVTNALRELREACAKALAPSN